MIPVEEALSIVLDNTPTLETQTVDLMDSLGRTLAEDVRSDMNMPPFDKSAMDGYAVVASDTAGATEKAPVVLDVLEDIPAGSVPRHRIGPGKSSRIMTGAPVPEGADAVVIVEVTERDDERSRVRIFEPIKRGENICKLGEDISLGQIVLERGKRIRAQEIGVLASVGRTKVKVIRQPEVSIIATGSEIVEPDQIPKPGQIRNSNGYSMSAQAISAGAEVKYLGIADDMTSELEGKVLEGLKSDVLVLSGGVSVGDYDLVKDTLQSCGVQILFEQVRIKPGKPTTFGVKGSKLVFGLPGNPVSTMVIFEQFVRPTIRRMQNMETIHRPVVDAILKKSLKKKPGRRQYAPARTTFVNRRWHVEVVRSHGSADLLSMARADSLLIVPEECTFLEAGSEVRVQLIGREG